MKMRFMMIFLSALLAFSCQDDNTKREAAQLRDLKKKDAVFSVVEKSWNFNEQSLNPQTQDIVSNWSEWRLFLTELRQKPKSSIGAFQKKARDLSLRVMALNSNIPIKFAQPEIRSRIAALITKVRSLDLFIHLDDIPPQKIIVLVSDINRELNSLSRQMEEITARDQVPLEQGESDMIRMLDTTRAIPSTPKK